MERIGHIDKSRTSTFIAPMNKTEFVLEFEKPIQVLEKQVASLRDSSRTSKLDMEREILALEAKIEHTKDEIYASLTSWQRVQIARHPRRPTTLDYVNRIFTDFQELHGDRLFKDDAAIVAGPAFFNGEPVMVIGHQKGRDTKANLRRNFGCPHPEGYRKALRMMRQAEKFRLPLITLVDTPGAYPGIGAEERHVAEAIAVNIREMSQLTVPVVTIIIGEGGSGGALGIAVANRVSILENAYYSVISPEGCAAILWKDRAHAPDAADALRLDAHNLVKLGVADRVVPEPRGGAHNDPDEAAKRVSECISEDLRELSAMTPSALRESRYAKFRVMGRYQEGPEAAVDA